MTTRQQVAEVLAAFLAEHYSATGVDLVDAAMTDPRLRRLVAIHAQLPAVVEASAEECFRCACAESNDEACGCRQTAQQANDLLYKSAEAIRHRLHRLTPPS
ncbi:hypothetical protein [Kribbella deserti]|uniref:Uncharacterized protein n=1 Tax=Kribbella deserti TaxID=1926257 RepID=A0ABV6QJ49_9ACTN